MRKTYRLLLGLCLMAGSASAQDATVPLNQDVYRVIDRYHIKHNTGNLHTSFRPYGRARVAELAEAARQEAAKPGAKPQSRTDKYNINYLLRDNWNYTRDTLSINTRDTLTNTTSSDSLTVYPLDSLSTGRPTTPITSPPLITSAPEAKPSFFRRFYRNRIDLYHYDSPDFTLRVNPVLGLQAGVDNETDGLRYLNTRGVQVEGSLDGKLGFYTFLADNQVKLPGYVNQRVSRDNIVPHEAYWKTFGSGGYDFFSARGYVNYAATKHISVMLGHDRNFIGNGFRSMILSDYAAPYFFLKLQTQVWKLQYTNLYAELTQDFKFADQLYDKKYMTLHHLSVNLLPNLNVGVFESVIFGRDRGRFELQYLNPVIFYRSVEQGLGSEDNALLGMDFKWNILNRVQFYGQAVLDEFLISELRAGNGWWGNKFALQGGAKYIDAFGISNLDLQGELNLARPFTYQHEDPSKNYQHYLQPLAHPMGANLAEAVGIVRYQPLPKLTLTGKLIATRYGQDPANTIDEEGNIIQYNFGGNVLKPYTTRPGDYGFQIGDGVTTNQVYGEATASFQIMYNMFLDVTQVIRRAEANDSRFNRNSSFSAISFRWNIPQRTHEL
ncbi:hypothetical protein [Rufibacter tibetensis]|uniref:Capsule assembly Wzi family protein n=1 Tax=Rufibacter tibetensis TaxID=512763 RepID=A0A0P0C7E5_9BACT|nr:hypothetical protein [Rufibacter tibetensis]ALI99308.1 hypothetical protein DC20_10355 [Rufibacter tibetensis]